MGNTRKVIEDAPCCCLDAVNDVTGCCNRTNMPQRVHISLVLKSEYGDTSVCDGIERGANLSYYGTEAAWLAAGKPGPEWNADDGTFYTWQGSCGGGMGPGWYGEVHFECGIHRGSTTQWQRYRFGIVCHHRISHRCFDVNSSDLLDTPCCTGWGEGAAVNESAHTYWCATFEKDGSYPQSWGTCDNDNTGNAVPACTVLPSESLSRDYHGNCAGLGPVELDGQTTAGHNCTDYSSDIGIAQACDGGVQWCHEERYEKAGTVTGPSWATAGDENDNPCCTLCNCQPIFFQFPAIPDSAGTWFGMSEYGYKGLNCCYQEHKDAGTLGNPADFDMIPCATVTE